MKAENIEKSKELKEIIKNSKKICVFTGAGISCPSGIPDFRSADGLYNQKSGYNYSPEEIISHSFFARNPDLFYDFYKSKMLYPNAQPNKAHRYFADLEKQGKDVSVVTQNIDGLHQKAGSSKVFELTEALHEITAPNAKRATVLNILLILRVFHAVPRTRQ